MKKVFSFLLIFSLTFSLVSCAYNNKTESTKTSESAPSLSSDKENTEPKKDDDISKNKKITIVIDPGHSNKSTNEKEPISPSSKELKLKDTLGATGVNTKMPEYETTMGISLELEKILKERGYNVILTKDSVSKQMSNIERAEVGNRANADLLIRIHCDSFGSPNAHGASMLVPSVEGYITDSVYQKSSYYGKKIIDTYTSELGIHNRGVVTRSDLTGFNWSKVPVVLLELGFISNPKEDALLSNPKNHYKIALSIANGIDNCF